MEYQNADTALKGNKGPQDLGAPGLGSGEW